MKELDEADTRALVAVQRLQAAYGDAVTRRDWDALIELFEPDAVVHIDTRTRPAFSLEGPSALAEFVARALEPFAFFELAILNAVADVDGDTATGRVYICEIRHDQAGRRTQAFGLYRDDYVRRDGEWRIAGRRYSSLARSGETVESFAFPTD